MKGCEKALELAKLLLPDNTTRIYSFHAFKFDYFLRFQAVLKYTHAFIYIYLYTKILIYKLNGEAFVVIPCENLLLTPAHISKFALIGVYRSTHTHIRTFCFFITLL